MQIRPNFEEFWTDSRQLFIVLIVMALTAFDQFVALPAVREFYHLAWRLFGIKFCALSPDGKVYIDFFPNPNAPFCSALGKNPRYRAHCCRCDQQHLEIALKQRRPLRYRCYLGLRTYILPIYLNRELIAVLMGGQIFDQPPTLADWRRTRHTLSVLGIKPDPFKPLFYRIKVIPPAKQKILMSMLQLFSHAIVSFQEQIRILDYTPQQIIVKRADHFVEQHLADPLTLAQVAHGAGTSLRNLTRLYRKERQQTVLQAIHEIRLQRACTMLQSPAKCAQIAFECGFGSIAQFNRIFRAYKKTTPSRWRNAELSLRNR